MFLLELYKYLVEVAPGSPGEVEMLLLGTLCCTKVQCKIIH